MFAYLRDNSLRKTVKQTPYICKARTEADVSIFNHVSCRIYLPLSLAGCDSIMVPNIGPVYNARTFSILKLLADANL